MHPNQYKLDFRKRNTTLPTHPYIVTTRMPIVHTPVMMA